MSTRKRKNLLVPFTLILLVLLAIYYWLPSNYMKAAPDCDGLSMTVDGKDPQTMATDFLANKKPSEFRYFFKTFDESGARTFMMVNMRNDEVCFDAKILVEKWDKLGGMRKFNGKSYPKELYDLKWHLEPRHDGMHIVYDDMREIID